MCMYKKYMRYGSSKFLIWIEFLAFTHLHWVVLCSLFSCLSEVNYAWTAGRWLTVNHMVWCKMSPVFLRVNIKCPNIDKRDPCILMTVYVSLYSLVQGKPGRWQIIVLFKKTTMNIQCFQCIDRQLIDEHLHHSQFKLSD